ncbi:MAG TPA: SPOR domain-containing protein [Methylomirabilota bacterium]|jgi:hypothetical protein
MTFGRDRHDSLDEHDDDTFEDEPSRSIFSATWFRALLVFIALAVIAVVAMPYALEWANPPTKTRGLAKGARPPASEAPPSSPAPVTGPVPVVITPKPENAPPPSTSSTEPRVVSSIPGPSEPSRSTPPAQSAPAPVDTARVPNAATPGTAATPPGATTPPGAVGANETPKAPEPAGTTENLKPTPPARPTDATRIAQRPRASDLPKAETPAPSDSATAPGGREATDVKSEPPRVAAVPRATETAKKSEAGPFWIQVGAFRDADTARRVAEKLREQQFPVAEPEKLTTVPASPPAKSETAKSETPSAPGPDRYDVFVSGTAAGDLNTRLESRGVTAEAVAGGAVLKPSMPLADAVALAKELSGDGLRVQVRRASGSPRAAASPPATEASTLYRVRVGSYADRTTALAALHDLEAKGYKPFLARGAQ